MISTILNVLITFNNKQIIAVIHLHVPHIMCALVVIFKHKQLGLNVSLLLI